MSTDLRVRRALTAAAALTVAFGVTTAVSAAAPPAPTPVASALTNPRGFTWDESGNLVVALAGSGGESPPTEDTPTNAIIGPWTGGTTAAVVSIDAAGCPTALATGLPSTIAAAGDVLGAEDVAYLDGQLYIGVDGGGAGHGLPDNPSGIYRVADDGSAELVADLSTWVRENPVAAIPGDFDPDAAGYSIVVEPESGTLWVGDPNSGQILSRRGDGTVTRVADVSDPHIVPTRLALDPEGGVYVGTLTTFPFTDGTAQVMHVATDGTVGGRVDRVDHGRRRGRRIRRHAVRLGAVERQQRRGAIQPGNRSHRAPDRSGHRRSGARRPDVPDRHGDRGGRGVLRRDAGDRRQRRQRCDRAPRGGDDRQQHPGSERPRRVRGSRRVRPDRGHHRHDASSSPASICSGIRSGIRSGVRTGARHPLRHQRRQQTPR